jgi:hypothetical protein
MRHIITDTPQIAEASASNFTLHPRIPAIATADPDILIIGITAGIVISRTRRGRCGDRSCGQC